MKQCPECKRVYTDETLNYCLDDGVSLVYGPASGEHATAILSGGELTGEAPTRVFVNSQPSTATTGSAGGRMFASSRYRSNILVPAVILTVLLTGLLAYRYLPFGNSRQIGSIAVLPFENASGDSGLEYLSDGMTETLINTLTQLPNLNVKARSSVFRYKGKDVDPQSLGKELGVEAVLNGRVMKQGEQLLLSLELVDVRTGNQIWGDKFSRAPADLVMLQSDIAREVSGKLRSKLSGADAQRLAKNRTENSEAYQLYLKGRYHTAKRTLPDLNRAIDYYQQALYLDSGYALAYVGIADANMLLADYGHTTPRESYPKAKESLTRALALDADLGEAHVALCNILSTYEYDQPTAERECTRAVELDPQSASARHSYGLLLTRLGRHEESIAQFRRGLEFEPLTLNLNKNYAEALFYARRYDESVDQFKKTLELDPNFAPAHASLSAVYHVMGRHGDFVEELARFEDIFDRPQKAAALREAFAAQGWQGITRLLSTKNGNYSPTHYTRAIFSAELGAYDEAFAALEEAYQERIYRLGHLKVDPRLDPLRRDPRFGDMLRKVGLSE